MATFQSVQIFIRFHHLTGPILLNRLLWIILSAVLLKFYLQNFWFLGWRFKGLIFWNFIIWCFNVTLWKSKKILLFPLLCRLSVYRFKCEDTYYSKLFYSSTEVVILKMRACYCAEVLLILLWNFRLLQSKSGGLVLTLVSWVDIYQLKVTHSFLPFRNITTDCNLPTIGSIS